MTARIQASANNLTNEKNVVYRYDNNHRLIAGAGIYTLETLGFGNVKFNFNEMLDYGFGLGFESLKNYAVGGIVGNLGLASKKRFSIKNFSSRLVVKETFLLPGFNSRCYEARRVI